MINNPKAYSVKVFNHLLKRGQVKHGMEVTAYNGFIGGAMKRVTGMGWYRHIAGANDKVLFCAHADTVTSGTFNYSRVTRKGGLWSCKGSNIGADDKAGMAIILTMIMAGVPGHYCIFDGEEVGCVGSEAFTMGNPDLLAGITHAIAFDRAGKHDVITHQGFGMTCSVECAEAISTLLNDGTGFIYSPCDTGVLTDTLTLSKSYPAMECTNLSVGYEGAHSQSEVQDVGHMSNLCARCVAIGDGWSTLPVVKHEETQDYWMGQYGEYEGGGRYLGSTYTRHRSTSRYQSDEYAQTGSELLLERVAYEGNAPSMLDTAFWEGLSEVSSKSTIQDLIENYPDAAKAVLMAVLNGFDYSTLIDIEGQLTQ